MKNNTTTSVIIPIYNVEKYLSECLDSVINQTYRNLEIILVDDGSSDSSGKIANKYAKKDTRITIIHKQNEGVSVAKNLGIKTATGKFITFIDADDYIRKDFVENLVNDMSKHNAQIVTTATEMHTIDQDTSADIEVFSQFETLERMFYGTLEKSENGVQMFDRQLLAKHKILFDPKKKIGEDFDFFAQALRHCNRVVIDYRKMYYYRSNPTSAMHQKINAGLMKAVTNFSSVGEGLTKIYPELRKAVDAKKFNDSVALAMRSYHARLEWCEDYDKLLYNIKSLKWQILLDRKVRAKVRIAAFVYCTAGNQIGTRVLRRIKR